MWRPTGAVGRCAPAAVLLALLLGAPTASADAQIFAGPPNSYLTSAVTIDQGERITFMNLDAAAHDVLARDPGPDGKPLFRSELASFGQTVPVTGVEYLTTGEYRFLCSVHPQMEGTITVTSAGEPEPRPDGEPEPRPGADPVGLELQVLDKRRARVKRRRALRVRITTSAAARVRMKARAKGKAFAKGTTKVTGAETKTVKLSLTRAGRRLVNRRKRVRVTVTATANDGQDTSTTKKSARSTLG